MFIHDLSRVVALSQGPDSTALGAALALLEAGLRPVPIRRQGEIIASSKGERMATGKEPVGMSWGKMHHTPGTLRAMYEVVGRGVGLKLGREGRVVDFEVDGPQGMDSLLTLLEGEDVPTAGWISARGPHYLFAWDDRFAELGKSVIKIAALPDLEIRLGAVTDEDKQLQSVVPPTVATDGKRRRWNGVKGIAALPDSVFVKLDEYLKSEKIPNSNHLLYDCEANSAVSAAFADDSRRKEGYLRSALEREVGKILMSREGNRNIQLNDSAYYLGKFVGGGEIPRGQVEGVLLHAGQSVGLGEKECLETINSGINAGEKKPKRWDQIDRGAHKGVKRREQLPREGERGGAAQGVRQSPPDLRTSEDGQDQEAGADAPWDDPEWGDDDGSAPFPLDALPAPLGRLCRAAADSLCCPVDFLACAALAAASGAIGRSATIRIKFEWIESAALYLGLVGDPGSTKSPSVARMNRPLVRIAGRLLADRRMLRHHMAAQEFRALPPLRRVVVDDATVEALAVRLQDNPRGLLMVRDELSALCLGMNQYKNGNGHDRQFYLSCWSNQHVVVDRKGDGTGIPVHIPHPFLSIVGGMTPDMVGAMGERAGRDDGFIDRFLFSYPKEERLRWTTGHVDLELVEAWDGAIRRLWARQMVSHGDGAPDRPWVADLSTAARERYAAWFDAHCAESCDDDFPRHLKGHWAKLRAYCARIALVLECLRDAYGDVRREGVGPVAPESIEGAIRIVDYFKSHGRKVRCMLRGTSQVDNPDVQLLVRWIVRDGRREFAERDIRRAYSRRFPRGDRALEDALSWMEKHSLIRPIDVAARPGPGRKPSPRFAVNPALFEEESDAVS